MACPHLVRVFKVPCQGYANSSDLADDLDLWLAGDPIRAQPPTRFSLTWAWIGAQDG